MVAWQEGWPAARASAGNAESEDEEEEAPNIAPLPKEAVKDQGDGRYKLRSHKVQAASLEEALRLLDAAYQEEQQQIAKVQRMAKREKRRAARSIEGDVFQRPGALHELRPPRAAYEGVFRGRFAEDEHRVTFIEEGTWIRVAVEKHALRNDKCAFLDRSNSHSLTVAHFSTPGTRTCMQLHTFRLHQLAFADGYTLLNGGAGWATKQLNVEVPASLLPCLLPRSLARSLARFLARLLEFVGFRNGQLSANTSYWGSRMRNCQQLHVPDCIWRLTFRFRQFR